MFRLSLLNCFWLMVPVLVWNLIFARKLSQEGFKDDFKVSTWILTSEGILRNLAFVLPILMPLQWQDPISLLGIGVYAIGLPVYCSTWLPLIYAPGAGWSKSPIGLLAPYVTPLFFFFGIALIGQSWLYLLVALLFVVVHTWHGLQSFDYL